MIRQACRSAGVTASVHRRKHWFLNFISFASYIQLRAVMPKGLGKLGLVELIRSRAWRL